MAAECSSSYQLLADEDHGTSYAETTRIKYALLCKIVHDMFGAAAKAATQWVYIWQLSWFTASFNKVQHGHISMALGALACNTRTT